MFHVHLIAAGRLKKGPLKDLFDDYHKRLGGAFTLTEIEEPSTPAEHKKFLSLIDEKKPLIVMDERGKNFSSRDLAQKLSDMQTSFSPPLQIIIGGADGLSDEIRAKATLLLNFGTMTWPHMLIRVMLMEQIYRCQQILSGHPYHRD